MNRYIVRTRSVGDDALFGIAGGSPGPKSVVVRAPNADDALRMGASQMSRPPHTLEVVKMEDAGTTIPVLASPEQIKAAWEKRGDQDTRYLGPM